MYAQSNTAFSRAAAASVLMQQQQSPLPDYYVDTLSQLNSCSSGYSSCSPTTTPIPNMMMMMMQRSFSSHSLLLHNASGTHHQPLSPLFENPPFRRVYSTGHLQLDSPLSSESSSLIIEGMSRVSPYSPQEKKLRIERYRTKRNQRNFNKKIKYACRKTLADRRPRIRGRFARNDEINKNTKVQWSHIGIEDEEDDNWMINIFDSIVAANIAHDDDSQGTSTFGLLY